MTVKRSCVPNTNLIRALRAERINYLLLVGEGIDNAFDAGARTVVIKFGDDFITFDDDGCGITKDRIDALFSLGEHAGMSSTALGRFGVGIKMQAVNAGNLLEIASISVDGRVQASADWEHMLRCGRWEYDEPRWTPTVVGKPTGTLITIAKLRPAKPRLLVDKILDELALIFHPALAVGSRIIVNDQAIQTLAEPAMSDVVDQHITLSDGRNAHVHGGILAKPGKLHHVHVGYKHRVIMSGSTLGCGTYGGMNNMFARVQLDGPWEFARFKNDLPRENERIELDEAVEEVLRPILEKCNSATMSARVDTLLDMINALTQPELQAARPRRKQEKGKAAGKRESRSGNVRDPDDSTDGPATTRRPPANRILITFDGNDKDHGIGYYQSGRVQRVNLAKDNPYMASLMAHRDQALAAQMLHVVAMMLFEQGRSETAPELPGISEPFGKRIAKLLTLQDDAKAATA
jgi:hypothetical protein